ncbi:filamentous hemagglutinin N-terminal domain-containing protein, partial [Snodgrassella sp. W8132]|uniref:two-partner secretion domain-containing protein n=1 Tax=Snodgrassella sp. W8132 TaxID=2750994 RepID=UPI0018DE8D88
MNKNLFKVIFNKKRGQMMAVAENTIREGKSTADSTAGSTAIMNSTIKIAGLPVLAWSILLGFGLCTLVIDSSRAGSIHADTSAPKNQQPTILQTANGTPQINIRTPTKGGVSINQFRQMDVDNKGAILNNSRKNTETRLAGWIQANPWLSKGEARVIVNQINSTNPSQLNGYIEVAGRRAEVIIANPAGINVNGSGFINAAGVTLTTGKPLIKNGNLDGFEVRQGNISIGGDGLDTGSSEYTRILSQAAQINAGIWANNLNITAGSNNTDAQGNITESVLTSAENKPLVAIDAGKLGGMYAGKIVLVSTDKGVGVNNAGQIYAGNGNLSIDANGYLSNSGSIVVSDQKSSGADIASVSLNADRVTNSGTVSSQGKMLVHSEQLENSGLLTTADEINIRQQKLHNQGEINAGRIDIIADNIHNQNGKIIQTGTQGLALDMNKLDNRNNGLIGYAPEKDKPAPSVPEHKPEPAEPVTPPTTAAGSGQTVSAVNTHKTQFETGQIIGNQEIINDNGQIIANGGIDLTSKTGLNNHGSLNLNKLTVSGEIFDNYQGKLSARQALINTNSIDNHQGEITTTELLSAKSGKLDNRKGKLQSVKNIDIDSAQLDNSDNGLIAAQEQLSIQSGNINNSLDGKIQSGASLKLNTNNLNNRQGSIDSNSLILKADIVDNSKGAIRTNQQLNAQIGSSLNNQGGEFGSGEDILLNSEGESRLSVDNSDGGKIIANKNAYLNTESIKNNNKGIISSENLNLKAARAENTAGGVIQAGKQLKAQIDEKLNNMGGNIASNEELLLNADGPSNLVLNNSANGKIQAGKGAVIHASTLDNSNDGSIDAGSIDLTANSVNNAAGAIRTNQRLKAQIGSSLNNQGGEFGSGGDVLLNSEGESHLAVDNSDGGKIIAGKDAYLNTESIKNNNKGIISSENLHLKASVSINNSGNGVIQSSKEAVIQASTLDNSNNGSIDADSIDLTANSVNNAAGAIRTNQRLKAQIGSSLNNQGGEFGSGGDVLLNSEGESHLA